MVLNWFKKTPLLDDASVEWLFDGFAWSLTEFGSDSFFQHTILTEPTDKHFPGRASDPHSMACLILEQVKEYAGVSSWPCTLLDRHQVTFDIQQLPTLPEILKLNGESSGEEYALQLLYEPQQVRSPEVMIANFSHLVAHHMGYLAVKKPPCDDEQWFHMAELVAVYLGFGLMLANTASPYRGGGCGRCVSPLAERTGYLSEDEVTYALAIFAVLKEVPEKTITQHLKRSLVSFYKRAVKEIKLDEKKLGYLRSIQSNPSFRALGIDS